MLSVGSASMGDKVFAIDLEMSSPGGFLRDMDLTDPNRGDFAAGDEVACENAPNPGLGIGLGPPNSLSAGDGESLRRLLVGVAEQTAPGSGGSGRAVRW
jgi:hypothetical protein